MLRRHCCPGTLLACWTDVDYINRRNTVSDCVLIYTPNTGPNIRTPLSYDEDTIIPLVLP